MSSAEENRENGQEENAETGAEKKERRYWPAALALTLLLLAGGGYYAMTGMRQTAHKLGGGSDYDQLSANSSVYEGGAREYRDIDVFAGGADTEAGASAPAAAGPAGSLNPALTRNGKESAREGALSASVQEGGQTEEESYASPGQAAGQAGGGSMSDKLRSKAAFGSKAADARKPGAAVTVTPFSGREAAAPKISQQSDTAAAGQAKAGKGGVLDALKGTFRASYYGARLSSKDAARGWIARTFDATPEADKAIEYDPAMRTELDKINPDSIPRFLREQDVSAAEAKTLATADVSKPKLDKEGTYDALKKDKDYQQKKMASDFAGSMLNGMFAGVSGTGSEEEDSFADPEDRDDVTSLGLGEFMDSQGNGEECGCTAAAPCCCVPQDYFNSQNNCPMYGPFLPDDPCGQSFYNDGAGIVN